MSEVPSGIFVATTDQAVFVRVIGRGTFRNSPPLRQFALETIQRGCQGIWVDLAECHGMDSTFLGVLAGMGLGLRQGGGVGQLDVINASERNIQSLRSLGLDRLMRVNALENRVAEPPASDFRRLAGTDQTESSQGLNREEAAKLMLEAHENLCQTDERNEQKFADVKHFLHEEIARRSEKDKPQ